LHSKSQGLDKKEQKELTHKRCPCSIYNYYFDLFIFYIISRKIDRRMLVKALSIKTPSSKIQVNAKPGFSGSNNQY